MLLHKPSLRRQYLGAMEVEGALSLPPAPVKGMEVGQMQIGHRMQMACKVEVPVKSPARSISNASQWCEPQLLETLFNQTFNKSVEDFQDASFLNPKPNPK